MHEGRRRPSCISFHLNAARIRCAPRVRLVRVRIRMQTPLRVRAHTSNPGRLPGSGGKVMQERSEKRFLHHFPRGRWVD